MKRLPEAIFQVRLFGVNVSGKPHSRSHVQTPAVEVQIQAGARLRIISAVEADDVVVLVFDPDASFETSSTGVFPGRYIDDDAAHLTQKFATHECKVVILALEIFIENHHLREAERQKLHGVDLAQLAQHALAEAGGGRRNEGAVVGAVAQVEPAQEVDVARRSGHVQ